MTAATVLQRAWHSPTLTTWGSMAVRASNVLVVLPMVLRRFEPAEVAVWQLFASIFTLMLLVDWGLSPSLARLLAYARGGARLVDMLDMRAPGPPQQQGSPSVAATEVAARILATLRWLYPRVGALVVAFFAVAGSWSLQTPISQCGNANEAWAAWGLVLLGSWAAFQGSGAGAALQGMNNIATLRRWEVLTGLAQIGTSLAVLALGGGLLALVATYQAWTAFGAWRNGALLRHLHADVLKRQPTADSEVLKVLWPATWRSAVGVLLSQGIIQGSGLVYSQLAPAAEVASYLLAVRVITTLSQFSQAPFYSKLPALAAMQAQHDRSQQLQVAQRGMLRSHWVMVAGVLAVAYLVPWLLKLAHSKTAFVSPQIWALMCAAFFVERLGAMHLQLYSLTNHILWHIANGVTGVAMLALALMLYPAVGLAGLPLAMLLAYILLYTPYALYHSTRAFHLPLFKFESGASLYPGLTLLAGLLPVLIFSAST